MLEPGRAVGHHDPLRDRGHRGRQPGLVPAPGRPVAGDEAGARRVRDRRVRLVHRDGHPPRHTWRHLDRRGPPCRVVRLGALHPRLRRPRPKGRRVLTGRVGRPRRGRRRAVRRPRPRRLRDGLGRLRDLGPRRDVAVDVRRSGYAVGDGRARRARSGPGHRWDGRGPSPPRVSASLVLPSSSNGSPAVDSPSNLTDGAASLPAHAAEPTGSHRCRRLPRVRQVPRHRGADEPRRPGGDAGPGQPSQLLGRRDLRRLERRRAGPRPTTPPTAGGEPAAARIAVHHSGDARPGRRADRRARPTSRPSTSPSRGRTWSSTPTTRSGSTSSHAHCSCPATAPSCRPRRWARAASTRSCRRHRGDRGASSARRRRPTLRGTSGRPSASSGRVTSSSPTPIRRSPRSPGPITSGVATTASTGPRTYDMVEAVESWMASHVHYTTDIPPLPVGADAVDSFLFGSRRGYCEQISTATVVMLRSLGIPAREAVGYVPGSYNPITDLYDVQAKDAHAWVQVWFPGYGWQNFDPTAAVPLANPSPGSVITHDVSRALGALPWLPIGIAVAACLGGLGGPPPSPPPPADVGGPGGSRPGDRRRPARLSARRSRDAHRLWGPACRRRSRARHTSARGHPPRRALLVRGDRAVRHRAGGRAGLRPPLPIGPTGVVGDRRPTIRRGRARAPRRRRPGLRAAADRTSAGAAG